MASCFPAAEWVATHSAQPGWHNFSQGYQDSVLMSLWNKGLIGHKRGGTYVEFGFHLKDVTGTTQQPPMPRPLNSPRHLTPRELPSYGANSEILARNGWSGIRMDGDESAAQAIPNLHLEFITVETIVALFRKYGVNQDVDYVSIDIDSCDLWVFLALTDVYQPRLISIEYNSLYAFNDSRTNICSRPQDVRRDFFGRKQYGQFYSTALHGHWLDGVSLKAIHLAAQRRGYTVIWVETHLDVFLARSDLLCPETGVALDTFAADTGMATHTTKSIHAPRGSVNEQEELRRKWTVEYV